MKVLALTLSVLFSSSTFALDGIKSVIKVKDGVETPTNKSHLIIEEKASSLLQKSYDQFNKGEMPVEELVKVSKNYVDNGVEDKLIIGVNDASCSWDCVYEKLIVADSISGKDNNYIKIESEVVKNIDNTRKYLYTIKVFQSEDEYVKIVGERTMVGGLSNEGFDSVRRENDEELLKKFKVSNSTIVRAHSITISK